MSSSFLTGKVALVTGGTGTIGTAIAGALLSEGVTVILTARRKSKLEEVQQFLLSDEGRQQWRNKTHHHQGRPSLSSTDATGTVHVIPSDISKEQDVIELFRQIDNLGCGDGRGDGGSTSSSIDLLINNAGINVPGSADDLSASDMESVLGVNVVGAFLCAREAMVRFKRKKKASSSVVSSSSSDDSITPPTTTAAGGRIINIGSISSYSPRPNSVAYTTSKFALQGLTRSLALDGRPYNIAVGIIHPGNVISDLLSPEDIEIRRQTEGFLHPQHDVAQCVLTMANLPYSTNVLEMTVYPTTQPYIGRG